MAKKAYEQNIADVARMIAGAVGHGEDADVMVFHVSYAISGATGADWDTVASDIRSSMERGRKRCDNCNLMREVAMEDGSRICVCDGGCDELEQVQPGDRACDKYEELW